MFPKNDEIYWYAKAIFYLSPDTFFSFKNPGKLDFHDGLYM